MRKTILILSLLLIALTIKISTGGRAQEKPLLMRQPTMSRTQIVFSYAGDLWIAPRNGGAASQLTIELRHCAREAGIIVAQPDAQHFRI